MLADANQKWDRLRVHAEVEGDKDLLALMERIEQALATDIHRQAARFESYRPQRHHEEPHDAGCQIVRLGPIHGCTCKSNMTRRRQQVINAARAGDLDFRETLGGIERYAFDLAVKGGW